MPASVCEPVSNALRVSLAGSALGDDGENGLDGRLLGAARSTLLTEIEFEAAGDYQSSLLDSLKSKYAVIRPKPQPGKLSALSPCSSASASEQSKNGDSGLARPSRVLFPQESVVLGGRARSVGAGMHNVGNTCYLNSTLQALFHVPAFANWLTSDGPHSAECRQSESCVICAMRATLMATQKNCSSAIKPWQVYCKLRLICRHLTPGRQEDAHEFLRYLVEAMEKCYLSRFPSSLDQHSKETTPLNQILGGYLRSTVRCLACHHLSVTYQHFEDLLLDIRKHNTLEEALDSFFARERLEDLGYKCEACNKKVSATKQFVIERAPMVLCIALKRFSLAGGKLSKHIQFRKKIVLNKYMHKQPSQPLSYRLVSMVTHLGPSQNCGHYTAIGLGPNGNFYQFDDSCVRMIPLSAVLGTNAYIMFYERESAASDEAAPGVGQTSAVVYGPQLPDHLNRDSPAKQVFQPFNITEKTEKPQIILNSTLKNDNRRSEPWTIKQNGEVVKVNNGNVAIIKIKINENGKEKQENGVHKKMEAKETNGSKLVAYDEGRSGDECDKRRKEETERSGRREEGAARREEGSPKATQHSWTVSHESGRPLLSPSLNGVVNNKVKEKSPNTSTSTSTMSSPSEAGSGGGGGPSPAAPGPAPAPAPRAPGDLARHATLNKLQHMSHSGYGAPVDTWAGTHANIGRQVYEERREERKRAHQGQDEMDAGRHKRVKYLNKHRHHYRHHYNPFQEKQNRQQWMGGGGGGGGGFKYHGNQERRYHYHHKPYKYNKFNNNRYNGHQHRHH